MGTGTDLFLADYWLLVVHHAGWQGLLPDPCRRMWGVGESFESSAFQVLSRLNHSLVRSSRDTLTLLIDALAKGPEVLKWRIDPPGPVGQADYPWTHSRSNQTGTTALKSPPRSRRREKRAADIDDLTREMQEHLRVAKSAAKSAVDFGREPQLLPRPSKQELGKRVGLPEYAVTRCFQDKIAKELRVLYEGAEDLQFVLDWRG